MERYVRNMQYNLDKMNKEGYYRIIVLFKEEMEK